MLKLPDVDTDPGVEAWTSSAAQDDKRERRRAGTCRKSRKTSWTPLIRSASPQNKCVRNAACLSQQPLLPLHAFFDYSFPGRLLCLNNVYKQVAAWQALFKFLETHTTADSVPASPRVLPVEVEGPPPERTDMTLTGLPIAWKELWGKLR
eukprot:6201227-Pleurochrysis_carterae.AAC.5